jgi:hypothetical protein
MSEEDMTVQESLEFFRVDTLSLVTECVVRRSQPPVEEISDFDGSGMSPTQIVRIRLFFAIVHCHKAQNFGQ